jgi:hypothetical protein
MPRITQQTTLAELAVELAAVGCPVVTVRPRHNGDYMISVIMWLPTKGGHYFGSGETLAEAINKALGQLREGIANEFRTV